MTKLKFINSSKNERERERNIVEVTVTKLMIFELLKLLINAEVKMSLNLIKVMMKIAKQD